MIKFIRNFVRNGLRVRSINAQWNSLFPEDSLDRMQVNERTVLGLPTVSKIIRKYVNTIASLPIDVYRVPVDTKIPVPVENITSRIVTSARDVYRATVRDYVLRGRGLILVVRREDGSVEGLYNLPISQTRIRQENLMGGFTGLIYEHFSRTHREVYTEAEVIDLVQIPTNQRVNWNDPLKHSKRLFQYALFVQQYADDFFKLGARHLLTTSDANVEGAKEWARKFVEMQKRAISEKLPVIPAPKGADLKSISASPNDALLIDAQRQLRVGFADVFDIHPSILGGEQSRAGVDSEQTQNLFLTQSALPVIEHLEYGIALGVWPFDTRHRVQFDTSSVSRGSHNNMADAYAKEIQSGQSTPNEVRVKQLKPPMDGGDYLFVQDQLRPLPQHIKSIEQEINSASSGTEVIPDDPAGDPSDDTVPNNSIRGNEGSGEGGQRGKGRVIRIAQ